MANSNSNRKLVPEAMDSLDRFKYEVASEVGVKNIFKNKKQSPNIITYTIKYIKE